MKSSLYLDAGAPTRCANPKCGKSFAETCYRGGDGQYYCDTECFQERFGEGVIPIEKAWKTSRARQGK